LLFKKSCPFEKRQPTICGMLLANLPDTGMKFLFENSELKDERRDRGTCREYGTCPGIWNLSGHT
jgi:hypothetical protein